MDKVAHRTAGTSSSTRRAPRARRAAAGLLLLLAGLVAAVSLSAGGGEASAAESEPTAITEAPALTWGFKLSWRGYAQTPTVGDGAEIVSESGNNFNLDWTFQSGSYDEATRTTQLNYTGTAHWQKYKPDEVGLTAPEGYTGEPEPWLLDVTVSDPEITISADSSVLSAEVTSRSLATWEVTDYGRVPLENLEVIDITPTVEDGVTSWAEIPATLTEEGEPAFAGFYHTGLVLDPVSFSYTGPGGAPDFSETFDEEGQPKLSLAENSMFISGTEGTSLDQPSWVDPTKMIATSIYEVGTQEKRVEAFSLEAMSKVGEPLVLPSAEAPVASNVVAFDENQDRLLYHASSEEGITRSLKYDGQAGEYEVEEITAPQFAEEGFLEDDYLAWNSTLDLGYTVELVEGEWELVTYREESDGSGEWEKRSYAMPGFAAAENKTGYDSAGSTTIPTEATASDGSMIVLAAVRKSTDSSEPAPETIPAAYRLVLDEAAGEVEVTALPVEAGNKTSELFAFVKTGGDGQIVMVKGNGTLVQCQIEASEETRCYEPVSVKADLTGEIGVMRVWNFAIDPENGVVWYGGTTVRSLAAFRHGEFLGSEYFAQRNHKGGPVVVGEDHVVYAQTNEGEAAQALGSPAWGYGRFELLGFTPTVTEQPQAAGVSLGEEEESGQVTFTAAATGEPSPTVQWQQKAPGASRFTDVAGATGETLTVVAEPGMDGTEYRAVFENAAGRVASEAATLAVEYAPRISLDLANVAATEGRSATFTVLAEGNPEPTVTWERRAGGFWYPISAEDENFSIEGDSLTVLETNTEQSGSLFRAKLSNSLGSVHSRAAKLTVAASTSIPAGGIAVTDASLDWLGDEEMQGVPYAGGSNYFSAGVSNGDEATYRSVEGDAAVWQVSASGEEALATYATRAAHTSGGGEQVARLYGGEGRVEADGSATIGWDASFSVNFYGGLVPFTIEDPELTVEADGSGQLTATLVGCASSQADPTECTPLASATEVVVADFDDATVEPGTPLTIEPDYLGVTMDLPEGSSAEAQLREGDYWGSWPQSFVDFQLETGLDSYWYSSGTNDELKVPLPFTVDLEGSAAPASEPQGSTGEGGESSDSGGSGTAAGSASQSGGSTTSSKAKAAKVKIAKAVRLNAKGTARIATLSCPAGVAKACEAIVPARLAARIGGRRYLIKVEAPRKVRPGRSAAVTVALPKGARRALGKGKVTLRLRIVVRSGKKATSKVAKVTIAGRG
ncbi:MAG: HtaA domain-containing protein [Solirubrobacterales bacterium]